MYQGGKLLDGKLCVKAGGKWTSLQELVAFEQECKMYGECTG